MSLLSNYLLTLSLAKCTVLENTDYSEMQIIWLHHWTFQNSLFPDTHTWP